MTEKNKSWSSFNENGGVDDGGTMVKKWLEMVE